MNRGLDAVAEEFEEYERIHGKAFQLVAKSCFSFMCELKFDPSAGLWLNRCHLVSRRLAVLRTLAVALDLGGINDISDCAPDVEPFGFKRARRGAT